MSSQHLQATGTSSEHLSSALYDPEMASSNSIKPDPHQHQPAGIQGDAPHSLMPVPSTAAAAADDANSRGALLKKLLIALVLIGFVVFVIVDSLTNGYIRDGLESFLEWIQDNPASGFFVFMVVYMLATIFFVPGSILTLGAGFVFANVFGLGIGVLVGSLAVFVGASVGAIASFLLGRFLLRDWVSNTLSSKYALFQALDVALAEKGFRIMSLLRLSPIVPFNAINYIAGVTAIGFWSYVWAMFAILPGTILYVFLGASAGSLADSASSGGDSTVTLVVVIVGVIFGIGAIGLTSYYAKAELNKVIAEREAEHAANGPDTTV